MGHKRMVVVVIEVSDLIGVLMTPFIYIFCIVEQTLTISKRAPAPFRVGATLVLCDEFTFRACAGKYTYTSARYFDGT